jgi:hypothetical protein
MSVRSNPVAPPRRRASPPGASPLLPCRAQPQSASSSGVGMDCNMGDASSSSFPWCGMVPLPPTISAGRACCGWRRQDGDSWSRTLALSTVCDTDCLSIRLPLCAARLERWIPRERTTRGAQSAAADSVDQVAGCASRRRQGRGSRAAHRPGDRDRRQPAGRRGRRRLGPRRRDGHTVRFHLG